MCDTFFSSRPSCVRRSETPLCGPGSDFAPPDKRFQMTRDDFDAFCAKLTATTHVVQWGNASVWKVGGKIFAICSGWGEGDFPRFSFKCSDISYSLLTQQEGLIPAPYLARAKWVQMEKEGALSDDDLKAYIEAAHRIISGKLTKKTQKELGLAV